MFFKIKKIAAAAVFKSGVQVFSGYEPQDVRIAYLVFFVIGFIFSLVILALGIFDYFPHNLVIIIADFSLAIAGIVLSSFAAKQEANFASYDASLIYNKGSYGTMAVCIFLFSYNFL